MRQTPARTRIKICGITSVDAAQVAVQAGADAIGVVFAGGSPRQMTTDLAAEIVQVVPPMVTVFGVFQLGRGVDQALEEWTNIGDWAQLHGDEDELRAKQVSRRLRVIKGLAFEKSQVTRWDQCPYVRGLLIDGATPGGGRGFRHRALAELMPQLHKPIILAGGLNPHNVADAIRTIRPDAVDVSSGVESKPGLKDPEKIHAFCEAVRNADAESS